MQPENLKTTAIWWCCIVFNAHFTAYSQMKKALLRVAIITSSSKIIHIQKLRAWILFFTKEKKTIITPFVLEYFVTTTLDGCAQSTIEIEYTHNNVHLAKIGCPKHSKSYFLFDIYVSIFGDLLHILPLNLISKSEYTKNELIKWGRVWQALIALRKKYTLQEDQTNLINRWWKFINFPSLPILWNTKSSSIYDSWIICKCSFNNIIRYTARNELNNRENQTITQLQR